MSSRYDINETFVSIMGNRNVYFQPPESLKMSYPCIRYSLDGIVMRKANDGRYLRFDKYSVTLIDKNPDSAYVDRLLDIPYSSFDRFYTSENLNHWVYTIYKIHY